VTEWWAPVTGFHINPGGGLFLPGIRQQILSERAYLRTGAHNVRIVMLKRPLRKSLPQRPL
ncbi:hypothetical protein, partial [Klebsiella pneumoniae]|uniref:hypothetical protein n=1 Tax=Klebsiella pneumoniae TaxID=573 RepID=UPI003F5D7D5D